MKTGLVSLFFTSLLLGSPVAAQPSGTAGGKGVIERFLPSGDSEQVPFTPHHSFAYKEKGATWIVLTDREAPVKDFMAAKDPAEARRLWCEKEKASFVALKLDAKWIVDLYFLCPANGNVNTEMVSSANGLESVVVKFDTRSDSQLKGTLTGGDGSCPDEAGNNQYCTRRSDYTFDAPIVMR